MRTFFPSLSAILSFDVPIKEIVRRMILVAGVGWGRMESTAPASVFLLFFLQSGAIFFAFMAIPGRSGGRCDPWARQW